MSTSAPPSASAQPTLSLSALDLAFNDIWANNANAISHCYSSTDALKVDFTRTGKRSFLGMINDATNSVYRMLQGAVSDFFRQTCLDFIYGSIGLNGLERYYDELDSRDPKERVRLVRVRASAIEQCAREVVQDETVRGAWTLASPVEPNCVHSFKMEEKVVLLTGKSLYVCSYDYASELLSAYTKILLGDIEGIKEGLYIVNPAEGAHPQDNWGLVVRYRRDECRENTTASIKNKTVQGGEERVVAFRAISNEEDITENSQKIVTAIVQELVSCCTAVGACEEDDEEFVQHETIQSLAEAKAHAGLFGPLLENLKRRLWL